MGGVHSSEFNRAYNSKPTWGGWFTATAPVRRAGAPARRWQAYARLGILDFARTCCDILTGEGDADGYHLSACRYCDELGSEQMTLDCYCWLASSEDEANDVRLELVCVLYFPTEVSTCRMLPKCSHPRSRAGSKKCNSIGKSRGGGVGTESRKVRGLSWR